VNVALVAPDATVTDAGTVTAVLLLARLTTNPPLGAAVFNVTVQLSVPAPVIDPLVHVKPVSTGTATPSCRLKVFDTSPEVAVSVAV
jgi:hypothetical protein